MHVSVHCPKCETDFPAAIDPRTDCVYDVTCPAGHSFRTTILFHHFQLLFENAIHALYDGYYRESLGSFAASYERFIELFLRVVAKVRNVDPDVFNTAWKHVSRQSERQLGAFVITYISEFGENPKILTGKPVELRNKVVHQGHFPTKIEAVNYGDEVFRFTMSTIERLWNSDPHKSELIGSINEVWPTDADRPSHTVFPYAMISVNRPPKFDSETNVATLLERVAAQRKKLA